jgi:hypothetical protein
MQVYDLNMAQQTRTAGDLFRALRQLKEWKRRHPKEFIGYPSECDSRLWSWQGAYFQDIEMLVDALYAWEGIKPR